MPQRLSVKSTFAFDRSKCSRELSGRHVPGLITTKTWTLYPEVSKSCADRYISRQVASRGKERVSESQRRHPNVKAVLFPAPNVPKLCPYSALAFVAIITAKTWLLKLNAIYGYAINDLTPFEHATFSLEARGSNPQPPTFRPSPRYITLTLPVTYGNSR